MIQTIRCERETYFQQLSIRNFHKRREMAFLWTTIKYLTAALILSYAIWAYTEGEDALPYWYYTWYLPKVRGNLSQRSRSSTQSDSPKYDHICPPHQKPSPSRFGFGLGPGSTTVYGWPKKGGIYVLNGCVGIDLEFLGFDGLGEETDLTKEMRSEEEEEEEAHCNKSKFPKRTKRVSQCLPR